MLVDNIASINSQYIRLIKVLHQLDYIHIFPKMMQTNRKIDYVYI